MSLERNNQDDYLEGALSSTYLDELLICQYYLPHVQPREEQRSSEWVK